MGGADHVENRVGGGGGWGWGAGSSRDPRGRRERLKMFQEQKGGRGCPQQAGAWPCGSPVLGCRGWPPGGFGTSSLVPGEIRASENSYFCQAARQLASVPSSQLCVRLASGGDPTYAFNIRFTGEEVHGTSKWPPQALRQPVQGEGCV